MMAGPQWLYQDAAGHFSLTKWKARIDRYNNVNVDAYVRDGTLIGHYLIDEPNDVATGEGKPGVGEVAGEAGRGSTPVLAHHFEQLRRRHRAVARQTDRRYGREAIRIARVAKEVAAGNDRSARLS